MKQLDRAQLTPRQLLSLDACTRCGECIPVCPVLDAAEEDHATAFNKIALWRRSWRAGGAATGEADYELRGWRARLDRLLSGPPPRLDAMVAASYDCTLCGHCQVVCPVHIQTHDLWLAQRRQLAVAGEAPAAVRETAARVRESGNIAGRPAEERLSWQDNADAAGAASSRKEVVMYVGCLGSYYPQAFALPRSLYALLTEMGVSVRLLGADEACCGFPLYISGLADEAVAQAELNRAAIAATGATTVVTPCPSCYHTLHERYPEWLGSRWDITVLHGIELIATIADDLRRRLKPLPSTGSAGNGMRVTYHDPCDLGRLSGFYELPRDLLRLIPGLELVEMADHHDRALCCGGGGDVEMVRPELSHTIADARFAQALATGAEALVTACPQCTRALSAAARRARSRVRTYDVAELLLMSLRAGE